MGPMTEFECDNVPCKFLQLLLPSADPEIALSGLPFGPRGVPAGCPSEGLTFFLLPQIALVMSD